MPGQDPYASLATPVDPYAALAKPPVAVATSPAPQLSMTDKLFGQHPLSDSLSVIGSHLKNAVAVPYHAFVDPPRNAMEQNAMDAHATTNPVLNVLNHAALAGSRMLIEPTISNWSHVVPEIRAGMSQNAGPGHFTAAANDAMDGVPIAGPVSRGIENDAQQHGAIPALLGAGTDLATAYATAKMAGYATDAAGNAMRYSVASPEARAVADTRAVVKGSPTAILDQALRPPVTMPDFGQSVEASLPKIAAQKPVGLKGFADAANTAKKGQAQWYQDLKEPYGNLPLDTTPAVAAQVNSIPATNLFETPSIAKSTANKAASYDMTPQTKAVPSPILDASGNPFTRIETTAPQPPSLNTVDSIRQDTNAKLQSLWNKNGGDRYAAMSDPETARLAAVNDTTRNLVYDKLSEMNRLPVPEIQANQDLYGHLSDVAEVANKRATVASRQSPITLAESLKLKPSPMGVVDFATQRLLKKATSPDALTNSAIDRYLSPDNPTLNPKGNMLSRGVSATGRGMNYLGLRTMKNANPLSLRNPFLYTGSKADQ